MMAPIVTHTCGRRFLGPDNVDYWRENRTCSYCGCFHPNALMDLIRAGTVWLGPTDKSYKLYLHERNADGTQGARLGKFYFQHLSVDQQRHFVHLMNTGALHIGPPGHFYVLPFFVAPQG